MKLYIEMNIRYLICLSIFLIFLWQTLLILLELKDLFSGIDFNINETFTDLQKKDNSRIPHVIHQMWKDKNLSTYPIKHSHLQWKLVYPNYQMKLWTNQDLDDLLHQTEYKYLKSIYYSYSYDIQRADLGRLLILYSEGGIYADLDVFPKPNQLEYLLTTNYSLIVPRSSAGTSLINHFLISEKHSSILNFILHQLKEKNFYEKIYLIPYLEVFSTGSYFLTKSIKKYRQCSTDHVQQLGILSENQLSNYIIHQQGRSWHLFDGFIFNQIDENRKISCFFLSIFLCCSFLLYKYRFHSKNKYVLIKD